MKLTFLGTGTSQGIPVIGCKCPTCSSTDHRDKRLRTSAMIDCDNGVRILIDAGPDFRYQMLRGNFRTLDGVLLTHQHKDHIGGIDDLRAVNYVDYPIVRRISIYGNHPTIECVRKDYDYAFFENPYLGVPQLDLVEIDEHSLVEIKGVHITPIKGEHSRFEVLGYRIGKLAYLTDFHKIEECEIEKLKGVETLVVNALRFEEHHSHFNVEQALELIDKVKPQRSYLTHIADVMGLHAAVDPLLPENVSLAYDQLEIEI